LGLEAIELRLSTPTAQASFVEVAVTPAREAKFPGLGLGTVVQAPPFQWAISV
jgi:hypothetical protein